MRERGLGLVAAPGSIGRAAPGSAGGTAPTRLARRPAAALALAVLGLVLAAGVGGCGSGTARAGGGSGAALPGPWDWPTYGHDAQHTFHGRTTLTESSAKRLAVAWYYRTGDVVTATPTVVGGTVYVGSWDDNFYALDLATGALRWKARLAAQDAVTPYPGQVPRDVTSDGGLVTSSAWYEPASGRRPALVIFGGGYTLYALDAANGRTYWRHDYPGRPGPPDPNQDGTRIFSSPVVVGGLVVFGIDVDGQHGSHGYVAAASLATG
ncbi:MAG TPA: PQQ-binding-like beta-propeller repeat protein, partial [Acidimicrobiales bacterium]|nr:PQQ-binding-like beta-propeller repeat protein [Acidimicrobiales bacterium]